MNPQCNNPQKARYEVAPPTLAPPADEEASSTNHQVQLPHRLLAAILRTSNLTPWPSVTEEALESDATVLAELVEHVLAVGMGRATAVGVVVVRGDSGGAGLREVR